MDFNSALDVKADDVEKPPVLPQGPYVWEIRKEPAITESQSGEWSILEFSVVPIQAEDGVDEDDLAEFGSLKAGINRVSFMMATDPEKEAEAKRTLYRIRQFLTNTLGIDADEDVSLKEMLPESVGKQFLANATHRQVEDDTYVDVKNYAPLD